MGYIDAVTMSCFGLAVQRAALFVYVYYIVFVFPKLHGNSSLLICTHIPHATGGRHRTHDTPGWSALAFDQ